MQSIKHSGFWATIQVFTFMYFQYTKLKWHINSLIEYCNIFLIIGEIQHKLFTGLYSDVASKLIKILVRKKETFQLNFNYVTGYKI